MTSYLLDPKNYTSIRILFPRSQEVDTVRQLINKRHSNVFFFCQPGILASQPGMGHTHLAGEAGGPNHWTAREVPDSVFFCFSTADHFFMVFIVLLMPFLYPLLRCELSAELHLRLSFHWSLYSWLDSTNPVGFSPLFSLSPVAWQRSSNISNLPLSWVLISYIWRSLGEGNGTPLQYCCPENPMDGGAW